MRAFDDGSRAERSDIEGSSKQPTKAGRFLRAPISRAIFSCAHQPTSRATNVGADGRTASSGQSGEEHKKPRQMHNKHGSNGENGEGGIRTPGTGVTPYDGLANRCFKPLSHLS